MGRDAIGEFEHLIMLAILRLGPDAYGVPIVEEIEDRTGRTVSEAAAYLTLRRLEEKGWVKSWVGEPTSERGGRAKRYFKLLPVGVKKLRESRTALVQMWDGVTAELEQ